MFNSRCTANYKGDTCTIKKKVCENYCHGNEPCSVDSKGRPVCDCAPGYTGTASILNLLIRWSQ